MSSQEDIRLTCGPSTRTAWEKAPYRLSWFPSSQAHLPERRKVPSGTNRQQEHHGTSLTCPAKATLQEGADGDWSQGRPPGELPGPSSQGQRAPPGYRSSHLHMAVAAANANNTTHHRGTVCLSCFTGEHIQGTASILLAVYSSQQILLLSAFSLSILFVDMEILALLLEKSQF